VLLSGVRFKAAMGKIFVTLAAFLYVGEFSFQMCDK
jgi:hypothetical protein